MGLQSPILKFLPDATVTAHRSTGCELAAGDIVFFGADKQNGSL